MRSPHLSRTSKIAIDLPLLPRDLATHQLFQIRPLLIC